MNRSLLSGLWLCLFLCATVLSGLDQAEPSLGRNPLMKLQREGWQIFQDGVLRRELKPKETETFVFGEAGFSWKLRDLRDQLQILRREFQAHPTPFGADYPVGGRRIHCAPIYGSGQLSFRGL